MHTMAGTDGQVRPTAAGRKIGPALTRCLRQGRCERMLILKSTPVFGENFIPEDENGNQNAKREENMRKSVKTVLLVSFMIVMAASLATADYVYNVGKEHPGGDVSPAEAYAMIQKDPAHTFLVDCRTRAEYQFVGHPEGAVNIPVRFFSNEVDKKGYKEVDNPDFGKVLKERFNPETDTLIFMCRSGGRSCASCTQAVAAGFKAEKIFNMMGGFEGDMNKNKDSAFYGQRWGGGWRLEGLPWTYDMKAELMYPPDVKP